MPHAAENMPMVYETERGGLALAALALITAHLASEPRQGISPMNRQPSKIVAETVTAYRNGMTMKELADIYKVTVPAIIHRIFRYKMITGETVERGPDRVVIETVGEYRNGKTMKQIAAQYGVTQQNISYRVNTYRRLTGEIVRRNQNRS
jgi:uncharacterized protein (DUF433 family)